MVIPPHTRQRLFINFDLPAWDPECLLLNDEGVVATICQFLVSEDPIPATIHADQLASLLGLNCFFIEHYAASYMKNPNTTRQMDNAAQQAPPSMTSAIARIIRHTAPSTSHIKALLINRPIIPNLQLIRLVAVERRRFLSMFLGVLLHPTRFLLAIGTF